jgi:hypothetical protein
MAPWLRGPISSFRESKCLREMFGFIATAFRVRYMDHLPVGFVACRLGSLLWSGYALPAFSGSCWLIRARERQFACHYNTLRKCYRELAAVPGCRAGSGMLIEGIRR